MIAWFATATVVVTHDRMGRFVTFLARLVQDGWTTQAKDIAINEQTAIVEANGAASLRRLHRLR